MKLAAKHQEVMKTVPLFMDLKESDFIQIVKGTTECVLKGGDVLFSQYQPASDFFYVVDGEIKISLLSVDGSEKVVDIIKAGSTFAEAIIFKGLGGYPVNSSALSQSVVLKINAENYMDVLSHSTDACFKVITSLSVRTHWLVNEMERLSLHNASYRLINYLLENVGNGTNEMKITLSVPKHVIASRLSITPETLSRTLKSLSKKELLEVHEKHIILKNIDELRLMISL
jgi:CRP-like cAMP-binding protein